MLTQGTRLVASRYALGDVLGRGGMADVHRATDTVLEREVAVKILRDHLFDDSGESSETGDADRDRFRDEAQIVAALDHPGLVTVLDAGVDDEGLSFLVMDLVEGTSLATFTRGRKIAPHRVAFVGAELAAVLSYVHERGIVHRDVKPSNILVGRDGVVRLADFGIARTMSDPAGHTSAGVTLGTAAYIAPEQVRGERATPAADIYSLGLVLLEALVGRRAYMGGPMEAALARLHEAPLIPTSLPSGWPALLSRMTAFAPCDRPSASEVEQVLRGLERAPARTRRRRRSDR